MSQDNKKSRFCRTSDWTPYLPTEFRTMEEADWLARSRARTWAPYFKILGQRSPAYWRKSDILRCFKFHFGVVYPETVQALKTAGFSEDPTLGKRKATGRF